MAFEVELTLRAQLDIDEYTIYIAEDSPTEAAIWKAKLEELILTLVDLPTRFDLIPEAKKTRAALSVSQALFAPRHL